MAKHQNELVTAEAIFPNGRTIKFTGLLPWVKEEGVRAHRQNTGESITSRAFGMAWFERMKRAALSHGRKGTNKNTPYKGAWMFS